MAGGDGLSDCCFTAHQLMFRAVRTVPAARDGYLMGTVAQLARFVAIYAGTHSQRA
jgi:hypothetical protein